jgi:hypothetical protein
MKTIFFLYITPIFFVALFIPTIIRIIKLLHKKNALRREFGQIIEKPTADIQPEYGQFADSTSPSLPRAVSEPASQPDPQSQVRAS